MSVGLVSAIDLAASNIVLSYHLRQPGVPSRPFQVCPFCCAARDTPLIRQVSLAMPCYIPPEITDFIIHNVCADQWDETDPQETLLSCALVCRSWLPASRDALFRSIYLYDPHHYNLFVERVLRCSDMAPWLNSIQHMDLCDPSPGIRKDRSLLIRPIADPNFKAGYKECIVHRFIHDFAGRLPNLVDLNLRGMNWASFPPHRTIYVALSQFPAVHTLRLHGRFSTFSALCHAFSALPGLRNLTVSAEFPQVPPPYAGIHLYRLRRPALTTLWSQLIDVKGYDMHVYQWLSHTPTCSSLRQLLLHIRCYKTINHALARGFECAAFFAQGLQELYLLLVDCESVTFSDCEYRSCLHLSTVTHFNADDFSVLASFQSLHTLSIDLVWEHVDSSSLMESVSLFESPPSLDWVSIWAVIADSIAQLGPSIRDIYLRFPFRVSRNAEDGFRPRFGNGIELLDPAFSRDTLTDLSNVLFLVELEQCWENGLTPIPQKKLEDIIRMKLPELHKRVIPQVEFSYNPSRATLCEY